MSVRDSTRLHRGRRRMVRDRGRPAAVDGLRAPAHGSLSVPVSDELRRDTVTPGLHGGLSADLSLRCHANRSARSQRPARDQRSGSSHRGWHICGASSGNRNQRRERRSVMTQVLDLVPIWTLILAVAVFFYVLFDGFDLGVGMLFGFASNKRSRNAIMSSIAPIWDGNETWLVLGGLGLLAAFPVAFAVIIPAVYFPILVMLLGLVFRGVAFEFRLRDSENRTFWDYAFCYGSGIATFAQGVVLGSFIQGFEVSNGQFAGTSFSFLSPFTLLTGIGLMFGYALLGAGWLILKTDGEIQAGARRHGRICLVAVLLTIAVVSLWTPIMSQAIAARWFTWPNFLFLAPVPLATALLGWFTWRAVDAHA